MASASTINIPFNRNLNVATNEMYLRATINRNLEKLLKNDLALAKIVEEYSEHKIFSIETYKEDTVYSKGDIVVFIEYNYKKRSILNLYLLESMEDSNSNVPEYEISDGYIKDFSKSGWKNLNPFFSIFSASSDDETNLSAFIESSLSGKFHEEHELDKQLHKFGELSKESINEKVLLSDFSNISDSRDKLFWAYETGNVVEENCSGTYKKWGNGLIEYDLTFCLGDSVKKVQTISENGDVVITNFIQANSLTPLSSGDFNNDDYFLDRSAYTIFNRSCSDKNYIVDGIPQTNVDSQMNVYHGTIHFPIPFIDGQYMIFTSSSADSSGKSQSTNTLAFLNRKKDSVTAMLAIPNYNSIKNIEEILLHKNVFQCQILGRWK